MRYYNFLNEEIDKYLNNNEIFELAKKRLFIYRGYWRDIKTYEIFKTKMNRESRDMPKEVHYLLNKYFDKYFGWKARSEGVFCTGDAQQASNYEIPYIIVPIKPYKFLYSTKIKDLFMDIFDSYIPNIITKDERKVILYSDDYYDNEKDETIEKAMEKIMVTYTDKDIKKALYFGNEITFKCNSYILFNIKYFKEKYLL